MALQIASCQCGRTIALGDGFRAGRCEFCGSFLADHEWWWGNPWDEGDAGRCGDCDGRAHSHGRPYEAERIAEPSRLAGVR